MRVAPTYSLDLYEEGDAMAGETLRNNQASLVGWSRHKHSVMLRPLASKVQREAEMNLE
jgi:hypothetical protein